MDDGMDDGMDEPCMPEPPLPQAEWAQGIDEPADELAPPPDPFSAQAVPVDPVDEMLKRIADVVGMIPEAINDQRRAEAGREME